VKHDFDIGGFKIRYSRTVDKGPDPTENINVEMTPQGGGFPRCRIHLFWDSVTLEVFTAKGQEDKAVETHPDFKELDGILTAKGFPTYDEVMEKVHEDEQAYEDDPMGSPSQYEAAARVVANLLEDGAISPQDAAIAKLERAGFEFTNWINAHDPGNEEAKCAVMTLTISRTSHRQCEVDPDGSCNGESVGEYLKSIPPRHGRRVTADNYDDDPAPQEDYGAIQHPDDVGADHDRYWADHDRY